MLRKDEGERQVRVQVLMESAKREAEQKNDETLAACHARYEQLLVSSRQECQRLHELNNRLLEQLEERDKMIRSMQKEMAVLIGAHRPGRSRSEAHVSIPQSLPGLAANGVNGHSHSNRTGGLSDTVSEEEKSALTSTYSTPRAVLGARLHTGASEA